MDENFRDTIQTGATMEERYLQKGSYKVNQFKKNTTGPNEFYTIFYPEVLQQSSQKWPLLFVVNGTGNKASYYESLLEHYASWGFIVVGTEDPTTGTGESTRQAYHDLTKENQAINSLFYQKLDLSNVGLTGFSEGGVAVMNVITQPGYTKHFKTAVVLSPVSEEITRQTTNYPYQSDKVEIPLLLLAGTAGSFETEEVIPLEHLQNMYEKITPPKAMARRKGMDHVAMMTQASGYVTAWMRWQLSQDEDAGRVFTGPAPEFLTNDHYQDQQLSISSTD
ncbi:alpha/beta hydrolase family protein [Streptococcus sp. DD13]|uniref:alpha/beta hydrolase family protein n=1 Tax=Streptococcus sp. DD13 TaxID=1777881 RepID=UPI001E40E314|nr:alpha/beta hydrolase [Streptococcus sp. DD13]